ncbi:MAG: hypothetical protein J5988_12900 [Eubacterium sp.]|nr:hypothetical protein [Eubacterium sp.]
MKFVKRISLFFVCPIVLIGIGFGGGIWAVKFFYPGTTEEKEQFRTEYQTDYQKAESEKQMQQSQDVEEIVQNVAAVEETLNADTEYVVQERDLLKDTMLETSSQIPAKYMGMTRTLFLESMEEYRLNPPLSEKERGFVGLEVVSFSPERVVVQMNYEYVQPSDSFYIAVIDNEVVVLLEDMKTVFINTGISLEQLPELIQMKIMQMYWIEDEESLYNFLETYSS